MSVEQARAVLTIEAEGIHAVRDALGPEFVQAVDLIMACPPNRLIITGIGKSGLVGQKMAATFNSTGTPSFFLHPVEAMHGDLGMVAPNDVVLAISYSGETAELGRLLASLGERSVAVIAMTSNPRSWLAEQAAVVLNVAVPKEACPLGLAPTASTTATLALGDALAVALLQRRRFKAEDFRRNHPGGSLGERLKVAVREVMLTGDKVPMVSETAAFDEAIAELNSKNLGAVLITSAVGELRGIITDGDLRRYLISSLLPNATHKAGAAVAEVMTKKPVSIGPDLMAADALSLMQEKDITVLAVLDGQGRVLGILHLHDLLGKGEFRFLI
ncbi:KpsF/GutQ family sugar-phosphate isomerase [Candidatus Electronema sp. JC]|uniref:KpsF/GutQ family sugar-phosphate isomerase n=1 Tax=Candidatus Electronema sp. JC TaxID=3401570 RepID=UPI003B43117E